MVETRMAPVAVIGMACRLPGGVDSPEQLWQTVLAGTDLVTEIPADRWDVDEHYDSERGVPGRSVSRWGAFLDDVGGFDAAFFGIGEREAVSMDPQHRLLLENAWQAVEDAGIPPTALAGSRTGVFVGLSHDDYTVLTEDAGALDQAYAFTGTPFSMASGRIAYTLGLRGPALTVDTACSTGLLSVHLACRSLQTGESDLALAGAAMVMLTPSVTASASAQGMLSPNGRCRPFDTGADGFVRAEGCAMVLLKRLDDAEADGDRILAVIRGTASNQDGRSETITTPSRDAQVAVYEAALSAAGVDADSVTVVETHGTGTPVGDPLEFSGLAQVYGRAGQCALGSVKSNVGHAESAAGAVALVKAVMSLRHGVVPPMVHFTALPAELDRIDTGLFVPQESTPWPGDHSRRRMGVSSFGMSGTNVHAVLEQAPEPAHAPAAAADSGAVLFPLSATSADALRSTARRLADWVEARADLDLADLGYTLARRRSHRPVRGAVLAGTSAELLTGLRGLAESDAPCPPAAGRDDLGPVWVFSGQGSQWAAMGAQLLDTEPVFAATVAEIEPLIMAESNFSVTEAMTAQQTVTGIDRVQPTLFAIQVALAATLRSAGVVPGAVIGHSLGEVAAAVVAGALTLHDGVAVICRRSLLCARLAGGGAMGAVELPADQVDAQLRAAGITDVVVSVLAGPASTVVGGNPATVRSLIAGWEARDIMAREVAVDVASHSPHVDPILRELADALTGLAPMTPTVPFYSATTDDPRRVPGCDAQYWVDNLRSPVRFATAVQAALEDGFRVFGELAPHPLLMRGVEQTAKAADIAVQAVPAMRREQEMPHGMGGFVAELYRAGAAIDFAVLHPHGELVEAPLPFWTHDKALLIGAGERSGAGRGSSTVTVHPLLGEHVRLPEEPVRHAWQADVGVGALPWLADHQVNNVAAYPGAAYCEMALTAAAAVFGSHSEVTDVAFEQLLLLAERTEITSVASVDAPAAAQFAVQSDLEGDRTRHAVATLRAVATAELPSHDVGALLAGHPERIPGDEIRGWFAGRRIQFGPAFTALIAVYTAAAQGDTVFAEIGLPGPLRAQQAGYGIHPALLDACFQSVAAGLRSHADGGLMLPLSVGRLRAVGDAHQARYCLARITSVDAGAVEADLELLDGHGAVVLHVAGLRMGSRTSKSRERERVLAERLSAITWQQQDLPEAVGTSGEWLVVDLATDTLAAELTAALSARGAVCRLVGSIPPTGADAVVIVAPTTTEEVDPGAARDLVRTVIGLAAGLPDAATVPRLHVISRSAQSVLAGDPVHLGHGGLRGLLRVIGAEHPSLRPSQIDIDATTDPGALADGLLRGGDEDETAWRAGQHYVARLQPAPLRDDERRVLLADPAHDGIRLQIRTPGDLDTLEEVAAERIPPQAGQIEVAVAASSINFADVLVTFGRYPSFDGQPPQLGLDFAGTVTAVGPGVTGHRVGDLVAGFAAAGCWGTFITCDARLAATLPASVTPAQAAAVSTAYGTAWYGLHQLARLSRGDKVLIHSATGGVGQAAIAIARHAGAEIFATAGSAARRRLLHNMGIEHVYDSRSTEFAEQIRRDTDGYGVDVVLNSLTGPAQRAGVELLALGGRFVEIGKLDIYGHTRLDLYPFRQNLAFYCVDLALMTTSHPQRVGELLAEVYRLVGDGVLTVPEHTEYPLAQARTAVRAMSAAEHTGKLVLTMPVTGPVPVVVPPTKAKVFRKDGSYIVTGGMGGLGLFLAAVMASAGCGRIVLSSRSQPNPQAQKTIARLRAKGADVVVEAGNIAEAGTAARLVAAATATGLPLRGVLHAAAVVDDAILANISDDLLDRDWAPKVHGALHLHRATTDQPLDWFCSFSSAAALLGSPGQGAYAAANSWLDAFTAWRRGLGLPATAIAWGAWAQIGRGAGLAQRGDTTMITPEEGAHAFRALLRHDRGHSGYFAPQGTPWLTALAVRSPFAEAFGTTEGTATPAGTAAVRAELSALTPTEWPNRLRRMVTDQVGLILRRAIDPDRPFAEHGLDSLGNLELRTHIETQTGIRISPKTIVTYNTARTLAGHLTETLESELVS
ncbi:mycocerosate synthase [soil metagenome]